MKYRLCRYRTFLLGAAISLPLAVLGGDPGSAKSLLIDDAHPCPDRMFGDRSGLRSTLEDRGVTVNLDGNYSFQGVASGGARFGSEYGNVFSGKLGIVVDTGKADLWPGGFLTVRLEGRDGEGVLRRAGATSPVNNDALLPLVPDSLGGGAWGLTELTYAQFFSPEFGIVGGLINSDTSDANPIAGFLGSNDYFMNTSFLYSPVVAGTTPNVTLGGGAIFLPDESNQFKFLVVGSNETAGRDPFDRYEGTTFVGEWTTKYELVDRNGGMTLVGTYSIDQDRLRITDDPRILIRDFIRGVPLTSNKDSWAVMWNGFQYLSGDESGGWGLFGRFGLADGDPNPIRWTGSVGVGGSGLLPGRERDRWGIGIYHQEFSDQGVIAARGVDDETGGEIFYSIQLCRGMSVTLDAQVIDSAIPAFDTIVVLGARLGFKF